MNGKQAITRILAAAIMVWLAACKPRNGEDAGHAGHDHENAAGAGSHGETGICPEHDIAADECGICKPEKIAGLKTGDSMKLRLASAGSVSIAGITTARPVKSTTTEGVDCYAEFGFDPKRIARIAAPVGGVVQDLEVDLGDKVAERQVVARIWSARVAEDVAKAVLTHQTLAREQKLRGLQVTSEKDLQEAEANHRAACQSLRTLGFSEALVDELATRPVDRILLDTRAPFAGEITGRTAVRGALVDEGDPMFAIADRSVMCAELSLPESALPGLRVGQGVQLTVDSLPGREFAGKLVWISAELDETTRMVRARAEVPNPDGMIRARMFAKARVLTGAERASLLVPATAIQQVDGKPFLFVKLGDDLFDARAVRLGPGSGGIRIVAEGLNGDEEVATEHAFALKSQLLISRLGAGCADD